MAKTLNDWYGLLKDVPRINGRKTNTNKTGGGPPTKFTKEQLNWVIDLHKSQGIKPYHIPPLFLDQWKRTISRATCSIMCRGEYTIKQNSLNH